MKCPTDDAVLQLSHRDGIEIDYCPQCRGVWLDRGELDKIVERAAGELVGARLGRDDRYERADAGDRYGHGDRYGRGDRYDRDDDDDDDRWRGRPGGRKKRSSFLGELFDFG